MNQSEAIKLLNAACMRLFGCNMDEATDKQAYKALCTVIRNAMYDRRRAFKRSYQDDGRKQVYYMSMEFLVGTSLHNNLYNLGWEKVFTDARYRYPGPLRPRPRRRTRQRRSGPSGLLLS